MTASNPFVSDKSKRYKTVYVVVGYEWGERADPLFVHNTKDFAEEHVHRLEAYMNNQTDPNTRPQYDSFYIVEVEMIK